MTTADTTTQLYPSEPAQTAPRPALPGVLVLRIAERYALLGLVVVIAVFFGLLPADSSTFPTVANLRILSANQVVTVLNALAVLIPLVAGYFDFSVGAVAATSSVVTAGLMANHHAALAVCIVAGVGVGASVGIINGVAVSRFQLNSFISTLAAATILGGLIQWYTGGQTISDNISAALVTFGSDSWLGVPRPVWLVAGVLLGVWYLLTHTPYGRSLYAIGENPRAARLVGMPVGRYSFLAFVASGTLAGIAGVILTARTGGATADNGTTMLFPALAAVFLGATAVRPGRVNVWGTVIGVALVAVSVSGLTLAGVDPWVNQVFNGATLAVAVAVSRYLGHKTTGRP